MKVTGKENAQQLELINAADAATMLFKYVCRSLDEDAELGPAYSAQHPEAVAACMNAAVLLNMTTTQKRGFKLPDSLPLA